MRPMIVGLSTRESDVLWLASRGRTNAEIGSDLFLGEATIKTHMRNAMKKLGASDRTHAVALAYETGLFASPISSALSAAKAARPLLLALPRCRRHPPAFAVPLECRECACWVSAQRVVAELDAALAGGAS